MLIPNTERVVWAQFKKCKENIASAEKEILQMQDGFKKLSLKDKNRKGGP